MLKIKKDDEVVVLTGRDKGKRGEVLQVLDGGKLLVGGVNLVKKHERPNPNTGQRGGIVEKEAPIDRSNVALWNSEADRGDRVGIRVEDGKRVRYFKSNGQLVD